MSEPVSIPGLCLYIMVLLLLVLATTFFFLIRYCSKLEEQVKRAKNSGAPMDIIVSDTRKVLDEVAALYARQVLRNVEIIDTSEQKPASTNERRTTTK